MVYESLCDCSGATGEFHARSRIARLGAVCRDGTKIGADRRLDTIEKGVVGFLQGV